MNKEIQLAVNIAGIGDLVLASKSLRALKQSYPEAELWLMTSSEAAVLADNYPYIDRVIPFPIREFGRNRRYLTKMWQTVNDLRYLRFRHCINLYLIGSWLGAVKMGLLFSLLHADGKVGQDAYGFGRFLTAKVPADTFVRQHFVDAMGEIATLVGAVPDEGGMDVYWNKSCEGQWAPFFDQQKDALIIGINPGGDRPNRRWDPDNFATVIKELLRAYPARIVLFGGPGEEFMAKYIENHIQSPKVVSLTGKLNLNELCYIISKLDLFITNDSGPMHIATATGTPVVAIFGPENPMHLRPYTRKALYRVVYKDVPCRPCNKSFCENMICLSAIMPDDVINACVELLDTTRGIHYEERIRSVTGSISSNGEKDDIAAVRNLQDQS
ncbi:MAG: glycosyltransferase family 9 protein [Deltaproteobacteria bacterium]|nr:glycosyltransferase family 9 protein [Deltaproteobacteria bacterium]